MYFYFYFNDTKKQNAINFISSIIAQLVGQTIELPPKLKEVYTRCNNGKQEAAIHHLIAVLSDFAATEQLDDIFIVADALDECPTSKEERKELLELIQDIIAFSPSKIHLLVTSRPESDIKEILSSQPTVSPLSIQNTEAKSDIKKYIADQLAIDSKLKGWSSDVKLLIEDSLTKKANGM